VLSFASAASGQSETPIGVWQESSQRFQVEVAPCGDRLCGKLVWFRWPRDAAGLPLVDLKNPDPALRNRPLLGLTILQGLRRTGARTWGDGRIYNPNDGVNYRVRMSMVDDGSVRMRAYVLLPILGKTYIWTRVAHDLPTNETTTPEVIASQRAGACGGWHARPRRRPLR
jgi:uncharacterized protein (DUF2147 family)